MNQITGKPLSATLRAKIEKWIPRLSLEERSLIEGLLGKDLTKKGLKKVLVSEDVAEYVAEFLTPYKGADITPPKRATGDDLSQEASAIIWIEYFESIRNLVPEENKEVYELALGLANSPDFFGREQGQARQLIYDPVNMAKPQGPGRWDFMYLTSDWGIIGEYKQGLGLIFNITKEEWDLQQDMDTYMVDTPEELEQAKAEEMETKVVQELIAFLQSCPGAFELWNGYFLGSGEDGKRTKEQIESFKSLMVLLKGIPEAFKEFLGLVDRLIKAGLLKKEFKLACEYLE